MGALSQDSLYTVKWKVQFILYYCCYYHHCRNKNLVDDMPKPNPEVLFIFSMPLYSVLCSASCKFSCTFFFNFKRKFKNCHCQKRYLLTWPKWLKLQMILVCGVCYASKLYKSCYYCCMLPRTISHLFFVFRLLLLISSYHKVAFFNTWDSW